MTEEESGGGGGLGAFCAILALAIVGGIFWGTQHYNLNVPWKFDFSNVGLTSQGEPGNVKEASPPSPKKPAKNATEREKIKDTVWKFLRDNGLTREQTSGIMGNIQAESGYRPSVEEYENGVGYGLCQWSYERRRALEASVPKGKKVSDLDYQLDYLYREMHVRKPNLPEYSKFANEWDIMANQGSLEDAVVAFHNEFERSKLMNLKDPRRIRQAVLRERLPLARETYDNPSRFP